jgi:toxin-antitoxin system PIN domain toxin
LIWLFDVNVLIAIADSSHIFHEAIHRWLAHRDEQTWASCPITENGMIRVLSQPAYRGGARTPAESIATLRGMKEARPWRHVFWADDFSITDESTILSERIAGAKQITDVYLAALAKRHGGRLVTFDAGIAWQAAEGGNTNLIEIPAV